MSRAKIACKRRSLTRATANSRHCPTASITTLPRRSRNRRSTVNAAGTTSPTRTRPPSTTRRSGRTHVRSPVRDRRPPPRDGARDGQGEDLVPTAGRLPRPRSDPAPAGGNGQAAQLLGRAVGPLDGRFSAPKRAVEAPGCDPSLPHPAEPRTPVQATINWLGKLKLDRPSLTTKHTAFSTGC